MLVLKKLSYIPEVLFFFPPSLVKLLYFAARERQLFNFPSPLDVSLWWYCCSCCLKGKKHSYNTGSSPKWKRTVRIPLWPSYEKAEGNTWLYIKKKIWFSRKNAGFEPSYVLVIRGNTYQHRSESSSIHSCFPPSLSLPRPSAGPFYQTA